MQTVFTLTDNSRLKTELVHLAEELNWLLVHAETAASLTPAGGAVIIDLNHAEAMVWCQRVSENLQLETLAFSHDSLTTVEELLHTNRIKYYFTWPGVERAHLRLLIETALEMAALRAELQARQQVYELAGRATHDGLWEWDLVTGTATFSPRWKQMLGYGENEIDTNPAEWLDRVHPEERDQLREELVVHVDMITQSFQSEHRIHHKSGEYRWVLSRALALRDGQGKALRLVGSLTDITAQKHSEERLMHEAFHDALTGLANSALLRQRLERAAAFCRRRPDYTYAVLFLDIDRFKNINDSLGHVEGDQLLIAVAGRLRSCVRPQDLVARLSGDEFVVLLDDIGERQEAIRTAERMQRALSLPFRLNNQEVYATASMGLAINADTTFEDSYSIVRDADTAMYRAKARNSGQLQVFDSSMHAQAVEVLGIETSLRRALSRQELRLHYQPIVNLVTGDIAGFEALIRWYSPDRGVVSPIDFIPVAEETGLIIPIGRWVLREACRQMMEWQNQFGSEPPLFMSVNISPRQFTQMDLVDQIAAVITDTGIDPRILKLEVTESLLIDNFESTALMMHKLQNMNVRLCIDDFGTGYSSLSTLYQLPIHTLKVDRSFVNRIHADSNHGEIVDTIIMLAHNLGMDVIAEGIENEAQLQGLRDRHCEYGQGYLFSQPVEASSAGKMINAAPPWSLKPAVVTK